MQIFALPAWYCELLSDEHLLTVPMPVSVGAHKRPRAKGSASAPQERLGKQLSSAEAAGHLGWADPEQLGRCMQQGRAAQDTLYQRNLGLAHKLAYMYYSYSDRAVAYGDLIQVCAPDIW